MIKQLAWENKTIFTVTFGLFAFVALCLLVLLIWASVGEIDESIPGIGEMVPENKLTRVMTPVTGRIVEIYVKENTPVKPGQLLMKLDPDLMDAEARGAKERLSIVAGDASTLSAIVEGKAIDPSKVPALQQEWFAASQASYHAQYQQAQMGILQAESEHQEAMQRLKQAQDIALSSEALAPKYKSLFEDGGLSEREYRDFLQRYDAQRGDVASLKARVKATAFALEQARQRPDAIRGTYHEQIASRLSERRQQMAELQSTVDKVHVSSGYQYIRAPIAGVVNEQAIHGVGEVVAPGQTLMTLVPKKAPIVAQVKVANRDLTFVHVGQRALLRLDAMPYQKFGRLYGNVVSISPSTQQGYDVNGETTGPRPQQMAMQAMPFYILTIRPEKLSLEFEGEQYPLKSGMTVSADLMTRKKSLISFFTEPFKEHIHKAFRDPSNR